MVTTGTNIDNNDYNGIVTTVNTILGQASGDTGYGQNTGLTHVANETDVTAQQWDDLRTQMNIASQHQSGANIAAGNIQVGNIIGADASNTTTGNTVTRSTSDTFSIDNPDATKGVNDYISSATTLTTNKDLSGGSSLSTSTIYNYATANLTYTASWQRIRATVRLEFAGGYNASNSDGTTTATSANDHRRHFFNAGGKIIVDARMVNNSGAKANDWNTIIEAVGNVSLGSTAVTAGSGTASLSYRDLTASYQTILLKNGTAGSVYAENEYRIEARIPAAGQIELRLTFNDLDAGDQTGSGGPVDESVNGDVQIRVRESRPTSGVIVPAGTWSIQSALATF